MSTSPTARALLELDAVRHQLHARQARDARFGKSAATVAGRRQAADLEHLDGELERARTSLIRKAIASRDPQALALLAPEDLAKHAGQRGRTDLSPTVALAEIRALRGDR
jgi:hypothetical protein